MGLKKLNYFIKQEFKETKGKIVDIFACELRELGLDSDLPQKGTKPTQSRKMNTTNKNYSSQAPKENKSASRDNLNKFATKALEKQRLNDRFEQIENQLKENNKGKACEVARDRVFCNLSDNKKRIPLLLNKQPYQRLLMSQNNTNKNNSSQAPSFKGSKKIKEFYQHIHDNCHLDGYFEFNHACHAKHFNVCTKTIQRWINKLISLGLITNYKHGLNHVSRRKKGWQKLKRSRFTVVSKAKQFKETENVHIIPNGNKILGMYTQNDIQFLKNKDLRLPFRGRTSTKYIESVKKKAISYQRTGIRVREIEINHKQREIKSMEKLPQNFVLDLQIKAKHNKLQQLKKQLAEFKEVMANFFDKLKHAAFHNISQHFWLICDRFRMCFRSLKHIFEPKSRFKVNFRPLTYQQELELIKHFVPFSKISKELVDLYGSKFYNMCLQGFRKDYSKVTHEKSEYWRNHSKFKLSKGKYYTLEILNFELKAYVKRQVIISRQKQKLGQKYVEPKLYCHNI